MELKTFEFKVDEVKDTGEFLGYASVFGVLDFANEIVEKGAFTKTLKEKTQFPLCWYHDGRDVLGMVNAKQDEKGLFTHGFLNLEVQSAREKYHLMKQEAIKGLSIAYDVIKDAWERLDPTKRAVRRLKELKLWEISLCTFPINIEAQVEYVKSLEMETKPYENEHSARLRDPDDFDPKTFKRKDDGTIYGKIKVPETVSVIWGKLKEHNKSEDNPIPQSLRFKKSSWSVAAAKKWLKDNNIKYISFEPASKSLEGIIDTLVDHVGSQDFLASEALSVETVVAIERASKALNALLSAEPLKSTRKTKEPQRGIKSVEHLIPETLKELKKLNSMYGGKT